MVLCIDGWSKNLEKKKLTAIKNANSSAHPHANCSIFNGQRADSDCSSSSLLWDPSMTLYISTLTDFSDWTILLVLLLLPVSNIHADSREHISLSLLAPRLPTGNLLKEISFRQSDADAEDKVPVSIYPRTLSLSLFHTDTHTHIYMCVCVCVKRKIDNKVIQVEGEIYWETKSTL